MKRLLIVSIALLCILQSCKQSSSEKHEEALKADSVAKKHKINDYNTQFVVDAAHSSWAQLFLGKLAFNKGASQAVRNLGQQMINDHSKENKILIALATSEKINMPRVEGSMEQKFLDSVSVKKGIQFDKMYIGHLIEAHHKEIRYYEEALQKLTNDNIRAFAMQMLPMLRKHLSDCEAVSRQL